MMDNRNGFPFPRGASGRRGASASVGGIWRDGEEPGGRFTVYEPEDYDGEGVPIDDPPFTAADGARGGNGGIQDENAPGTCGMRGALTGRPLAMVYAPDQIWQELYEDEEALGNGTLFRELDFPFCPGCRKSGRN